MSSHDSFVSSGSSTTRKKKTAIPKANFRIEFHTSIYLIVPLCASGREWLDEHIGKDTSPQNRTVPRYPAGETLILGGGFRNRRALATVSNGCTTVP
jgi:hypothetical protein